jgi:hypothetical protein
MVSMVFFEHQSAPNCDLSMTWKATHYGQRYFIQHY